MTKDQMINDEVREFVEEWKSEGGASGEIYYDVMSILAELIEAGHIKQTNSGIDYDEYMNKLHPHLK